MLFCQGADVIRKLNEDERSEFINQLREGVEKAMCSSFERLLNKEKAEGKAEDIIELLEDIGEPSEILRKHIMEQKDFEVLRNWLKVAAKAKSIEDFEQAIGLLQI